MIATQFRKAQRQKVKASIMIEGLQGSGKSGLALAIASVLASSQDKIFAIDTENKSLDLFSDYKLHTGVKLENFNKADITKEDGYAPSNYDALRTAAINAGAEVLVMDSISHMWNRKGGLLDTVAEAQATGLDQYRSWGTEKNRTEKELIFDLIRSDKLHTIVTVRSKEKFGMELDEAKGKNKVVSLGEQQIQQEGLKYEPDLVIRMLSPGDTKGKNPVGLILKSRYPIFTVDTEYEFTPEILQQLKSYLEEGVDPDVLIEQQKKDYIKAIKEYCAGSQAKKSIWANLKEQEGYTGKIEDIPLEVLKILYRKLVSE